MISPYLAQLHASKSLSQMPPPRNPAERAVADLGKQIATFEADLSEEEEVGAIIIGAPDGTIFHITAFGWINIDVLVFEGVNERGRPQRLVQHVSQLSILLTALPKLEETPRRICFYPPEDNQPHP
jgi:hypothetical protein